MMQCPGSMSGCLGVVEPDELNVTLVNLLEKVANDEPWRSEREFFTMMRGWISLPANIELAGLETTLCKCNEPGNNHAAVC